MSKAKEKEQKASVLMLSNQLQLSTSFPSSRSHCFLVLQDRQASFLSFPPTDLLSALGSVQASKLLSTDIKDPETKAESKPSFSRSFFIPFVHPAECRSQKARRQLLV